MKTWERCVFVSRVLAVAAGFASAFTARAAADCETDAECGAGYVCQINQGEKCWVDPCPAGAMCPTTPTCETYRYGSCVHAPCDVDDDCPDPMLCHAETTQRCSGGGSCSRDGNCTMEPPVCETVTTTSCRQPYELPCTIDSDCGGGFRCVEEVYSWCMGSGPTPSRDAGTRPSMEPLPPVDDADAPIGAPIAPVVDGGVAPLPPPECGTTHTGRFSCQLLELPCNADADCPSGLDCVELSTPGWDCPTPPPSRDAGTAVAQDAGVAMTAPALLPPDQNGGIAMPVVDPMKDSICRPSTGSSIKMCRPPHWYGGGVMTPGSGPSRGEDGSAEPPKSPDSSNGRDAGVGAPTGPVDNDSDEEASDDREERKRRVRALLRNLFRNHDGCSITASHEALDVSWLLVVAGLAVTATRRRR